MDRLESEMNFVISQIYKPGFFNRNGDISLVGFWQLPKAIHDKLFHGYKFTIQKDAHQFKIICLKRNLKPISYTCLTKFLRHLLSWNLRFRPKRKRKEIMIANLWFVVSIISPYVTVIGFVHMSEWGGGDSDRMQGARCWTDRYNFQSPHPIPQSGSEHPFLPAKHPLSSLRMRSLNPLSQLLSVNLI